MTLFTVLVDVYHKEQLVTKQEAEMAGRSSNLIDVAVTKDSVTATRIADVLNKHGFNHDAQLIRGKCVYSRLCV